MKKGRIAALLLIPAAAVVLMALCFGNTAFSRREIGESERFTRQEILSAMNVAERTFRRDFSGCMLLELSYEEAYSDKYAAEWAENYGADEAIVLLSRFSVGLSGVAGGFNPNSIYDGWQWILTRAAGGEWTLQTWGYG